MLTEIGLGVRLAVGDKRSGLRRLFLMAAGVALGVALLIGGLGIAPAIQARHDREVVRSPVFAETPPADNYLHGVMTDDHIGDREVIRYTVAAVGRAPIPPGLVRIPGPGEAIVSPALGKLLSTALGHIAAERFGRVVGEVGPDGLLYPDEPVAYVGVAPGTFRTIDTPAVIGFGQSPLLQPAPVSPTLQILILLGVLALLIPTLVFVATSTRLSAASRERRLAAIRLVGASPRQVRVMAATESGLAATCGSILGVAVFFGLRPVVARLPLAGYQWFPSDIAPPVLGAIAIVVAAPLLAMGAALLSLRRLIVTPLGVARRARFRRVGWFRLVLLAAGFAGLGLCWTARTAINRGGSGALLAVGASFLLVLIGIAAVAPWLGAAAAPLFTRGERHIGSLLGARRLQADPTAAGRVVAAMALVVFGAGLIHALAPAVTSTGGSSDPALYMRPNSVVVEDGFPVGAASSESSLMSVQGVSSVVPLSTVSTQSPSSSAPPVSSDFVAWIADCASVGTTLLPTPLACEGNVGYVRTDSTTKVLPGAVVRVYVDGPEGPRAARVPIPPVVRRAHFPEPSRPGHGSAALHR